MFGRSKSTIQDRVAQGFNLLDHRVPGWHKRVRLTTLDIARGDNCALGQTYGSYGYGLAALDLDRRSAQANGFQAHAIGSDREYDELTQEWRRQIEARLDAEREQWAKDLADGRRRWWNRKVSA